MFKYGLKIKNILELINYLSKKERNKNDHSGMLCLWCGKYSFFFKMQYDVHVLLYSIQLDIDQVVQIMKYEDIAWSHEPYIVLDKSMFVCTCYR